MVNASQVSLISFQFVFYKLDDPDVLVAFKLDVLLHKTKKLTFGQTLTDDWTRLIFVRFSNVAVELFHVFSFSIHSIIWAEQLVWKIFQRTLELSERVFSLKMLCSVYFILNVTVSRYSTTYIFWKCHETWIKREWMTVWRVQDVHLFWKFWILQTECHCTAAMQPHLFLWRRLFGLLSTWLDLHA